LEKLKIDYQRSQVNIRDLLDFFFVLWYNIGILISGGGYMKDIAITVSVSIGLVVILCLLLCLPTKWLWNLLMPSIFGLRRITVLEALGLNMLCSILFKSSSKNKNDD